MSRLHRRLLPLLLVAVLGAGCASRGAPQPTFNQVDVERFLGRWYVLANIPYFAERGKVGSYVEYRARDDGRFDDLFFSRDETFDAPIKRQEGVAWIPDPTQPGRWKVRFIWPFTADFLLLYVDDDYETALIGHPSRDLAWVYSRTPRMDDTRYRALLERLAGFGYDTGQLQRVPQKPGDLPAS